MNPPSSPNDFGGAFVKPSLLVASAWKPCNWTDPAVSLHCATMMSCLEHPQCRSRFALVDHRGSPEHNERHRDCLLAKFR